MELTTAGRRWPSSTPTASPPAPAAGQAAVHALRPGAIRHLALGDIETAIRYASAARHLLASAAEDESPR